MTKLDYVWGGQRAPKENLAIGKFVSQNTWGNDHELFSGYTSLGVVKGDRLIAGVIYHDYKPKPKTVEISCAAIDPTWLRGPTLYLMYSYPFEQMGCRVIGTGNAESNKRLHRQLERLDHRKYVIDDYWGEGEDCYFWTLTKKAYQSNNLINRAKRIWMNDYVKH